MILTDREIEIALSNGQIEIEPRPRPGALSSTSLDLRLAGQGQVWKEMPGQPIRPGAKGYSYTSTNSRKDTVDLHGYVFEPCKFLLAWTEEYVQLHLQSRIAARVEGKSSLARLGLSVHVTAPTIHCGFKGQIQLEMYNFGTTDIILDPGMDICQLIFEQTTGTPSKGYSGLFAEQTSRS